MYCNDTCCNPALDTPSLTILSRRHSRARKAHRCVECPDDIAPGTTYERIAYLLDGEFQTSKRHGVCAFR